GGGLAALVLLDVDLAVTADLGLGPLGERGDGLGAHAVQAGGGLVGALVELGAGADGRQHDFERGPAGVWGDVHGGAGAVVGDTEAAVPVDGDVDVLAVAGEGLVPAVVDELVDEVVQPLAAGVADVHAGARADVGAVAQDLHALFGVAVGAVGGGGGL